jgi:F-type H+-transporting ATPase subunit epsilon
MVSVLNGSVKLVPTTFEWADRIDSDRAEASYQKAQNVLQNKDATATDIRLAEARLRRALVRKSVAGSK